MQEEELTVADEPPGGLWESEGMLGPGKEKEEDLEWFTQAMAGGQSNEEGRAAGAKADDDDQQGEHPPAHEFDNFWHNDDGDDDQQEGGLHDNHWKPDESDEETKIAEGDSVAGSEVHTQPAPQDCRHPTGTGVAGIYLAAGEESGKALGKRGNMPRPSENHDEEAAKRMARAERTFMVPVNMVESKYRKMPAPQPTTRTMPFRTGLLARMAQKGGVKPPRPCYSRSWADNLLQPIFGDLV